MQVCASYLHTRQLVQAATGAAAAAAREASTAAAGAAENLGRANHRQHSSHGDSSGHPSPAAAAGTAAGGGSSSSGSGSGSGSHHGSNGGGVAGSKSSGTRLLTMDEAASLRASAAAFVFGSGPAAFVQGPATPPGPGLGPDPRSGSGLGPSHVPIEDPKMPQGLAWHLVLRELTKGLVQQATQQAAAQNPGHDVRGIHVEVQVCVNLGAVCGL